MRRVVDNRYTILEALGSGGAGEVFLARDEVLGRGVALKVLSRRYTGDEEFVERFRREAQSAAALSHPNVVSVHDLMEGDGDLCIVMEYVQGVTLDELIEREGALPWRAAAAVALRTARGLEAAHRRGIVHRDVKPANILLANLPEGGSGDRFGDALADAVVGGSAVLKVTDFGVALVGSARPLTEKGVIMGTVQYISPEMVMGEAADPRSDLYSLGVVLYEMLTGRRPFEAAEAESPLAVAMRHVTQNPSPPSEANPEVPPGMDAATLALLAKDPGERPESAGDLADELEALLRETPAGRTPPSGRVDPGTYSDGDRTGTLRETPKTMRFRDDRGGETGRRRGGRRRALLRAVLAVLVGAALVLAGLAGADRLSDGGLSRGLGAWIPFGAPVVPDDPAEQAADAGAVVEDFVMGAWGYTGDDEEEYWSRVEPLVSEGFRSSPAWADVEGGADVARRGGPAARDSLVATEFQRFEVLEEAPASVVGVAYFVNEEYPEGRHLDYRQEFGLVKRNDGSWVLDRGEAMEPVNGVAAGEEVTAAVEDYYEAVDRGDWSYTYDRLDARARELFTEEEWHQKNQWFADNEGLELSYISVEATLSSGTLANVRVDRTFADGTFLTRNTFFVYEERAWKHRLSAEEVDVFMPGASFEEFVNAQGESAPVGE